jgi:hypothetical protein
VTECFFFDCKPCGRPEALLCRLASSMLPNNVELLFI